MQTESRNLVSQVLHRLLRRQHPSLWRGTAMLDPGTKGLLMTTILTPSPEGRVSLPSLQLGVENAHARGDVSEDIVDGDGDGDGDESAREARHRPVKGPTGPPRSARQTRRARRPASPMIVRRSLGKVGV